MSSACLPVYSPIPCSRLMFQWWKTVTSATFNLSRPLPLFLEHWNTATPPNFFKLFVTSVCFIATYKRIKLNWQKNQTSSVASHLPWCYLGAFASKSVNSQWLKKIHFQHIFFFFLKHVLLCFCFPPSARCWSDVRISVRVHFMDRVWQLF